MYRILIVEDDNGIAEAIRVQAEMWGLQVQCAFNYRNVMEIFHEFDPHLVLLDITVKRTKVHHLPSGRAAYICWPMA